MRFFAVAIVTLLCASTIPSSSASGDGVHWNGYDLDRDPIPNRVLIDQDGNPYSMQKGNADVTVVAFVFTTCVDVCPAITNNLVQAEKQLDDIDYQFISITVDPATDSPEVFKTYMDNFGATWPHLTGELVDLEQVWADFQISVVTEEVQSHDHEEMENHSMEYNEVESSVSVIMPDGSQSVYPVMPTGWDQLVAAEFENNWTINSTESEWGHYITGINGDETPSDNSWWWQLHTWNMSSHMWEESLSGIDSVDAGNLAFAPNISDDSLIPMPDMENESFVIIQEDGTNVSSTLTHINAWHMSLAALESFDAPNSESGHNMSTIAGVSEPNDSSWWWQLHYWDVNNESWANSESSMDNLHEQEHIAWAPNSTMDSMIPPPQMSMSGEMTHKLGVIYPGGNTAIFNGTYSGMGEVSAMEHTMTALNQNDISHEMENGTVTSINGIEAEYNLYIWHDMGDYSHWMSTSDSASDSILMEDANHYAWIADGEDSTTLMSPVMEHDEQENETTTSHSTQTFILNDDWEPLVVFIGYDWDVNDFVEDIERAANSVNDPKDEGSGLPGFAFATVATSLSLAIIAISREE
ncbi:MAG: SCO family protein [Euryarchaeota archaeon]|jgi:cytochrome oxidase Cu insertion factor (SCO1/SenC/PrrC family)|nr:SCO family protein [Euryarchaeota archaeon]MBT4982018.1 SCO family protein [Euryarchaeota archaeon]